MEYDPHLYPNASKRSVVYAKNGMVATSQPLAAQAGLDMLKQGGNAIDAAIATAACLTVVEPTSNGIGGDAFALIWVKDALFGLNASGKSPASITVEKVKAMGHKTMPRFGFTPVTVPGAPSAWVAMSKRFGKLALSEVLKPAIDYARNGYPLTPTLAASWANAFTLYKQHLNGPEYAHWFETFAPSGCAPATGDIWKSEAHAKTLTLIGESDGAAFYHGALADSMEAFSIKHHGFLRKEDLARHAAAWVEPISINYRGYDVWELPPNGQGIIALEALNIMKQFNGETHQNIDTLHRQIEATKLAFADGLTYITDQDAMRGNMLALIDETYAKQQSTLIGQTAGLFKAGNPPQGGTVYLATADKEGNMVSFIQSNYMGFGSGLVVPGTGIALQNRGHTFSLDMDDVNVLAPNKRTYHTIIPGFLTKDNQAVGPFGVMGGYMQPQGHLQVIMNTLDFQMNPQAALDAPRWYWAKDRIIEVEPSMPQALVKGLVKRGHDVRISSNVGLFGRGQIIWRHSKNGVLAGGTEMRTDGTIACW